MNENLIESVRALAELSKRYGDKFDEAEKCKADKVLGAYAPTKSAALHDTANGLLDALTLEASRTDFPALLAALERAERIEKAARECQEWVLRARDTPVLKYGSGSVRLSSEYPNTIRDLMIKALATLSDALSEPQ